MLWHVLACHVFHGTVTCSGSQPLTPSGNLPGYSIPCGDLRAICNTLMTVLTPLAVNDRAISPSIAA